MAALLERGLQGEGHQAFVASDGREGLEFADLRDYDVIVLDILLPVMDGFEMTRRLREGGNRTPVLMLTARDAAKDIVLRLDSGADDYLTKPFAFEELLARLRSLARRAPIERGVSLEVDDLKLNPASHEVHRGDSRLGLTPREFQVLELLMRRAGRVVDRNAIIEAVWGGDADVGLNTVDAFVSSLRRKVEGDGRPKLIHTVRGVGFSIGEPES